MKNIANVLICSLAVICVGAAHSASVTVPAGSNGLTFTGNSDLTFSSDLLAALDTGNLPVTGYGNTSSPVPTGNISVTPGIGISPAPLVLVQPVPSPTPVSSLALSDAALSDFIKSLQLLGYSGASSGSVVIQSPPIERLPVVFSSGVDIGSVTLIQQAPLGLILNPGLGVSIDSLLPDVLIGSDGLGQIGGVSAASVPELGSLPMMGLGLLAMTLMRRAKRS